MRHLNCFTLGLLSGVVALALCGAAFAQDPPDPPAIPGHYTGIGTSFDVQGDSLLLHIAATDTIWVDIHLAGTHAMLFLEGVGEIAPTELVVSGYPPNTTVYTRLDPPGVLQDLQTDAQGILRISVGLVSSQLLFLQRSLNTFHLTPTGWSDATVGTWDPVTKTGTLIRDVLEQISIEGSDLTLDGGQHSCTYSGSGPAVSVSGGGVTIRNLGIRARYTAISAPDCRNLTITQCYLRSEIGTASLIVVGVEGRDCSNLTVTRNTVRNPSGYGFYYTKYLLLSFAGMRTAENDVRSLYPIYMRDSAWRTYVGGEVVNNNFVSLSGSGPTVNRWNAVWSLPLPIGGNYWSMWTTPDANGDGFVDVPFVFPIAYYEWDRDELPYAQPQAWGSAGFTITASAGPGGSIMPSGAVHVAAGMDQMFTIAADPGYDIEGVVIDGNPVGVVTSWTFGEVAANHTIIASFVSRNRPPSANNDTYTTDENVPLTVDPPGVLTNDSDPDGNSITAVLVQSAANGSLTLNGDGSFQYVPNLHWYGTDNFSYKAFDGIEYSNGATVTIEVIMVNNPPVPAVDPLSLVSGECPGPVTVPVATANDDHDGVIAGTTPDPVTYTAPGTYTVHWTYTDSGGLTVTQDQTVQIVDSTPPQLTCPSNRSFPYGDEIDFGQPTVADACDPEVTITFLDVTTPGSCPQEYTIARTWKATDDYGNFSTCVQTVYVFPNTPQGEDVVSQPVDSTTGSSPVTLTFDTVTGSGQSTLEITGQGPPPPTGFRLGSPPRYYEITTGATFTGPIQVCVNYTGISHPNETKLKLMHLENGMWIDCTTSLDTEADVICGQVTSLSLFAIFEEYVGIAAGRVYGNCAEASGGLYGVTVDLFKNGTGILVGTAATDVTGFYRIANIEAADYTLTLVLPLGYSIESQEIPIAVPAGDTVTTDFPLTCVGQTGDPRGIGFWKHQVGVALGGKGAADIDATTLCSYLDAIEVHFNNNAINQVIVYEPPQSGACVDKLVVAKGLLNLEGNAGMLARAKQHFMALLLNVASGKLLLNSVISQDGATVSQAITYCDGLVTDTDTGNDETAKTIAERINEGMMVPAKLIPLDTENIAYSSRRSDAGLPKVFALSQNHPNPFNPTTRVTMAIPEACSWTLAIYDVAGRMVRQFQGSTSGPAFVNVLWDGTNNRGEPGSTGVYLYSMKAGRFSAVKKMVLLR